MMRWMLVLGIAGAAAVAAPLEAQGRGNGRGRDGDGVPPGHRPPAGQCRIWIDGVPPGRQPAPTSCAKAERNRPANGRVIYGDADDRYGKDKDKDKAKGKHKDDRRDRNGDDDDDDRRDRDDDARDDARDDDRRDRDGRGRDTCVDRNRDGRCDVTAGTGNGGNIGGYPRTLPQMVNMAVLAQGSRSREATTWLRGVRARAEGVDEDGNRIPERITWIGTDGKILQTWLDDNRDGRADRVEIYRDGRLVGTRQ